MEGGVFLLATDYRQLFIRSGIHRRGAESAEECGAQRGRGKRDEVARATLPMRVYTRGSPVLRPKCKSASDLRGAATKSPPAGPPAGFGEAAGTARRRSRIARRPKPPWRCSPEQRRIRWRSKTSTQPISVGGLSQGNSSAPLRLGGESPILIRAHSWSPHHSSPCLRVSVVSCSVVNPLPAPRVTGGARS